MQRRKRKKWLGIGAVAQELFRQFKINRASTVIRFPGQQKWLVADMKVGAIGWSRGSAGLSFLRVWPFPKELVCRSRGWAPCIFEVTFDADENTITLDLGSDQLLESGPSAFMVLAELVDLLVFAKPKKRS